MVLPLHACMYITSLSDTNGAKTLEPHLLDLSMVVNSDMDAEN